METPITGVISANSLRSLLWEAVFNHGDNLDEWTAASKYRHEFGQEPDQEFWDGLQIDDPDWLLGFKVVDAPGKPYGWWAEDPEQEFSAIISAGGGAYVVQVVRSNYTARVRSMCSPCYPGQADLESGEGDILAYTLPPHFFPSRSE